MTSNSTVAQIVIANDTSIHLGSSLDVRMSHDQLEVFDFTDRCSNILAVKEALLPLYAEVNAKLAGRCYSLVFSPLFNLADLVGLSHDDCAMPDFARVFEGVASSLRESGYEHDVDFSLCIRPQGFSGGASFSVSSDKHQESDPRFTFSYITLDPEVALAKKCFNPAHPVMADISRWYSVFMGTFYMRWSAEIQDFATPESHPVPRLAL